MKTILLSLLCGFTAFSIADTGAGSGKYTETMQKYIHVLDTANNLSTFISAANTFERIAGAEKKEWLPAYYAAYSYLNAAMATKDLDQVDTFCDKAESLLSAAGEKENAEESEILCLISLAYTARIRVDMFGRGLEYSMMADKLLSEAAEINPQNPRVFYLRARLTMGRPKQFGGGLEAGLPMLKIAAEKFAAAPNDEESLLPDWGRKQTASILARTTGK